MCENLARRMGLDVNAERGSADHTNGNGILGASKPSSTQVEAAVASLCGAYWLPVYAHIRRRGHAPHEAEDLTQEFFRRFLARDGFGQADPGRGRFEGYVAASVDNFLGHERARANAQKRGAGQRPVSLEELQADGRWHEQNGASLSPAEALERGGVTSLLRSVAGRARQECADAGRADFFDCIAAHMWGDPEAVPYAQLGSKFGMSLAQVKVEAFRLRQRLRQLLVEELRRTVSSTAELNEELSYLVRLAGS